MARLFYHVMQDNVGNLLFGVSGTMRIAGTGTAATIYGDEALTIILPNPMTNHPSYGSFKCYLGPGAYDFYMAKSGYSFETLTGMQGSGTMGQQDASAVAITGGTATLSTAQVLTKLALGATSLSTGMQSVLFPASTYGITFQPVVSGTVAPVYFTNSGASAVGSIQSTDSTVSYLSVSDARLKTDVDDLTGELALIQALRPVKFKWLADDSRGYGFIAAEVQQILPDAHVITGTPDAMNEDGTINPQMIDHSRLVPFLTGAVKSLIERVEALQARVEVLEDAAGV